jgi:hypothetical protein
VYIWTVSNLYVHFICGLQLEKLIGKVKTGKYGSAIIELMLLHIDSEVAGGKACASKRQKKDKEDVICVESSEEEDV